MGWAAQSPCVAGGVRIACASWDEPETFIVRCLARDFGTAGICRRPRIAFAFSRSRPTEAAFVFQGPPDPNVADGGAVSSPEVLSDERELVPR